MKKGVLKFPSDANIRLEFLYLICPRKKVIVEGDIIIIIKNL